MNELQEIKATVERMTKGIAYVDAEGRTDAQIDQALSLFHELSKTLAEQIRSFESKYGKLCIFDKESVE